jgi:phage shock protein E
VLTGADGSVGRYTIGYVVYCRSGNRSAAAAATMAEMGFVEVYDLGGIIDWHAGGLPVVSG